MGEEKKEFESWEEVILDFFRQKREAEEEKFLKERIKGISEIFEKNDFFKKNELRDFFDPRKNKKEKGQTSIEFQREKLKKILELKEKPNDFDEKEINDTYRRKIKEIEAKFEPTKWIRQACIEAPSVTFATHVFKLTHSKIDSKAIMDQIDERKFEYLTTSNIHNKIIDGAVTGNQYAPVYQFLELEHNGKKLAYEFRNDRSKVLSSFAQSEEELFEWNEGFSKALVGHKPQAHSLAKQVYFPLVNGVLTYHLLVNIDSSTLSHALYLKLSEIKQKRSRSLQNKSRYSQKYKVSFPNNAIRMVTQSNHGNASQLNGKRGGRIILLASQPPTWQSRIQPPTQKDNFFYTIPWSITIKENIDYLRDFLLRFDRLELSFKNPKRMKWIERWVEQVIDEVFVYVASVQNLPSGWSATEDIRLKMEHQYLLDPFRSDEQFQFSRKGKDWQEVVCKDFANWLNGKLRGRDKKFTPQSKHTRLWKRLMEEQLREYEASITMEIKRRVGVAV